MKEEDIMKERERKSGRKVERGKSKRKQGSDQDYEQERYRGREEERMRG